jgi:hypothetical protein
MRSILAVHFVAPIVLDTLRTFLRTGFESANGGGGATLAEFVEIRYGTLGAGTGGTLVRSRDQWRCTVSAGQYDSGCPKTPVESRAVAEHRRLNSRRDVDVYVRLHRPALRSASRCVHLSYRSRRNTPDSETRLNLLEAAGGVLVQEAGDQRLVRQPLGKSALLDRLQVLAGEPNVQSPEFNDCRSGRSLGHTFGHSAESSPEIGSL